MCVQRLCNRKADKFHNTFSTRCPLSGAIAGIAQMLLIIIIIIAAASVSRGLIVRGKTGSCASCVQHGFEIVLLIGRGLYTARLHYAVGKE